MTTLDTGVLLFLSQTQGAPPPPDAGALPPPPGEGAVQTVPGGAPAGKSDPLGSFFPFLLLLLFGMIIFTVMGQRRDRKKRQALIESIKKHDRVQTVGGVIGSVVEIKPDTVVLKVDESSNTRITFARSAIQQVLTSGPESTAAPGGGAS